jgi:hypothetical protein
MTVGRWPDRSSRSRIAVGVLLAVTAVVALGPGGRSLSLFYDMEQAVSGFAAGGWTPPSTTFPLGTLHVGDKCTGVAVGLVTSGIAMDLSVSVSGGWLMNNEVGVEPDHIGPGESAVVYFSNAAVNGPQSIHDTITVTGTPGGVIQTIVLTGAVENPADPQVHDPDPLPLGCVHPAGKIQSEPGLVEAEGAPVPEGTVTAPPESPLEDEAVPAEPEAPAPEPEAPAAEPEAPAAEPEAPAPEPEAPAPEPEAPAAEPEAPAPEPEAPAPEPEAPTPEPEVI